MAVAYNQIDELLTVIFLYVPEDQIEPLLDDLARTKAYTVNASFKATIDRLRKRHRARGKA